MYYGARYYDAAIGRFAEQDSLIADLYNPQSLNRYSYALNNPVRYTDPTGHCDPDDCRWTSDGDGGWTITNKGGGDTSDDPGADLPGLSEDLQSPCDQACATDMASYYKQLFDQTGEKEFSGHLKEYYGYLAAYYERVTVEGVDTDTVADMAGAVLAAKDRLIINGYAGEYEAYSTAWSLGAGQMLITLPGMAAGVVSAMPGGGLIDGSRLSINDALDAAQEFLGKNTDMGNGRFVSADGLRQVRMGDTDILGTHAGGSHMNFEVLAPDPRTGRLRPVHNIHIFLEGP